MSTMPVYAAVTRYGSHRPKHRRNIASRVLDRSATRIALHSHAYGMLLCSEAPELHTHTREEARGAARESVTDACRARCAESRGRGTRSFQHVAGSVYWSSRWTLESAWRRDREVITRQTGRSSGPAPARAAVGDLGGVARTRDASPPLRRTAAARLPPLLRGTAP